MSGAMLGDVFRVASAAASLLLAFTAGWAVVISGHWDQRVRFGIFVLFGALLTSGYLLSFGREWTWRLPVLLVVIIAAVVSTVAFVRREMQDRRGVRRDR